MKAKEIRDAYLKASANGVACKKLKPNEFRLTTSFWYSDNDLIDLWILESPPNRFVICDKGETFRKESDINRINTKDVEKAKILAKLFGVGIENGVIFKMVKKKKDLGWAIFDVAYTCQAISVLFSYNNL